MEFKEISISDDIIPQMGHKGTFVDIAVDVGIRDNTYSNVGLYTSYEDMLEEIERTMGSSHVFMRSLPNKGLTNDWSSWKKVDEINMERARYLLSTDEIIEEWHSCTQI